MASYSIEWKSSASREVRKLPKPIIKEVLSAVESLADDPRPVGVRKLTASKDTYRIRLGNYRIIYNVFDKRLVIEIIRVRDRKESYK